MKDARPCLDSYEGKTSAQLIALEPSYRTDSIVTAFAQAIEQAYVRRKKEGVTPLLIGPERAVMGIQAFIDEVNNGGFKQFFQNSSREYAPTILEDLESVGCHESAKIARDAFEALKTTNLSEETIGRIISADDQERDRIFDQCDAAFYETAEPIDQLLFVYIKTSQSDIRL